MEARGLGARLRSERELADGIPLRDALSCTGAHRRYLLPVHAAHVGETFRALARCHYYTLAALAAQPHMPEGSASGPPTLATRSADECRLGEFNVPRALDPDWPLPQAGP